MNHTRAASALLFAAAALSLVALAEDAKILNGQELAFSTAKGNCLACHQVPGDPAAITSANIGPPLVAMKDRFPDRAKLRAQIWDATRINSNSVMPPFGKHRVLTEEEIDKITDYVHAL
jgi:L-cysteine S-thiosulfotransferase